MKYCIRTSLLLLTVLGINMLLKLQDIRILSPTQSARQAHEDEGPPAPSYYGQPHHLQAEGAGQERDQDARQASSQKSW